MDTPEGASRSTSLPIIPSARVDRNARGPSRLFSIHLDCGPKTPEAQLIRRVGATELKSHVFIPTGPVQGNLRPAIVLLHGGGWNAGSPEWTYDDAKRYVGLGMVTIAGEYRLSDQKNSTPLEAMADARDPVRWVRQNAKDLAIDPHRIAIYGVSAEGHLAAAAAAFPHQEENELIAVPDALMLVSPAASIVDDHWPQVLLGTHTEAKDISLAENIKKQHELTLDLQVYRWSP